MPNHEKSQQRYERLLSQSEIIARRLVSAGVVAYRDDQQLTAINELTGQAELIKAFRHVNILPVVSSRERRGLLNDMSYFLENDGGEFCRYAVITWGTRVPYGADLRQRGQNMRRLISKWAAYALKKYQIEVLFRGDEFTFNRAGVHGHSNIVYRPLRRLKAAEWSGFLSWTSEKFGTIWRDCGRLKNANEVVKYVCKLSSDVKPNSRSYGLDQLSVERLGWFYEQTLGERIIAPMRSFAGFRRHLKERRLRVARCRGELVLMRRERGRPSNPNRTPGGGGRPENLILARTLPAPGSDGVLTTRTIVSNYTPNTTTGVGAAGLRLIANNQSQAAEWARDNGWRDAQNEAVFSVHNSTTTVHRIDAVLQPPTIEPEPLGQQSELFETSALGHRPKPKRRRVYYPRRDQPSLLVWAIFEEAFSKIDLQCEGDLIEHIIPLHIVGVSHGLAGQPPPTI